MSQLNISVVIITYNQEKFIARAIHSVLCQKEWVHEIIISDDCSKDNNWKIIYQYALQYPDLIKAYRNSENLGIYGNMRAGFSKVTGSAVALLSADDEYNDDFLKHAYHEILRKKMEDEVFLCYFDRYRRFADKRPNYLFSNKLVTKYNPVSLFIRGLICEPSLMSAKVLDRCLPPIDMGINADYLWSIMQILSAEKFIYYPKISHIYNAGIGVSVTMPRLDIITSFLKIHTLLVSDKFNFSKKDCYYLDFLKYSQLSYLQPSFKYFFQSIVLFFKSMDISLGFNQLRIIALLKYIARFIFYKIKK